MSQHGSTPGGPPGTPAGSPSGRTIYNSRYELHRRVGRGGMADVYLGRDQLLDRPVAIKVLFPEFAADPTFVERFRREAQSAANLNHPNVVGVYDWGQEGGTYYIVMEYVDGRSLAEILRASGRLLPERAADVAIDVAAALGFAHRNGVIHRDIKPANILITAQGQVKVADFGIARAFNSATEQNLTQSGSVMGTATYFSPEQAQGAPLDPRSDLYSLGIVLYEMLTGRPPFRGDNPVAIAYKQVHEAPTAPGDLVPDLAPPVDAITMKLLAKNPANRYPSAEELQADLRRYRGGQPVRAEPRLQMPSGAARVTPLAGAGATAAVPSAFEATRAERVYRENTQPVPTGQPPVQYAPAPPRRTWAFLVFALVLLAGLGTALFLLSKQVDSSGGGSVQVSVPSVLNFQLTDAENKLKALGLVPATQFETNALVPEGVVFEQDPKADAKVAKGSTVTLKVSQAATTVDLPSVVGLAEADALAKLQALGFSPTVVSVQADGKPEGTVLSQDPAAGKVPPKAAVKLTIVASAGQIAIPDVTGDDQLSAAAALGRNFQVTTTQEPSDTVQPGRAIRTEPPAGTKADKDSTVTLVISSGPSTVVVPNLLGQTQQQAIDALAGDGLQANVQFRDFGPGDAAIGRVTGQDPAPGTSVVTGSGVTITVGRVGETTTAPPGTDQPTTTGGPPPTT